MRSLALVALLAGAAHGDPPPERHGLAVGAELGEPTSATAAWFFGGLSVDAALGTGTYYGPGLSAHADLQLVVARLAPAWPLRVGLGGRYYDQHYTPMSVDETAGSRWGLRASAQLAYEHGPLAIYLELAPGVDLARSPTCNLADGPTSLCPHAMATPAFMQLVVGARWFLSH